MRELVCIVCPVGCSLAVNERPASVDGLPALTVSGNRCPRGAAYAQEEVRSPRRVVTATCASMLQRIPVKTSVPCPKEKILELLADVYKTTITLPVKAGDTVIANWDGLGLDVVATRTVH